MRKCDLLVQIKGAENRAASARDDYLKAVQTHNVTVRSFPSNLTAMALGYKAKPNFAVDDEKAIANPAKVDFGRAPK